MNRNEFLMYKKLIQLLSKLPEPSIDNYQSYFEEQLPSLLLVTEDELKVFKNRCLGLFSSYDEKIKLNLFLVYYLIYFLTKKFPDDLYGIQNNQNKLNDYLTFERLSKDYFAKSFATNKITLEQSNLLSSLDYLIKGQYTNLLKQQSALKNQNILEMFTCIVLLKEQYYGTKFYNKEHLLEFINQEFNNEKKKVYPRTSSFKATRKYELHAVSYIGSNHTKCDDFSKVSALNPTTWFACSCDGVGSAPYSHIGSKVACEVLEDLLYKAYIKYENNSEKLMDYIFYELGYALGKLWRNHCVKEMKKQGYALQNNDFGKLASTVLFTFGTRYFIVLGQVGDGNFIVEKQEIFRNVVGKKGYLFLNDSFSGVMTSSIVSVAHLLDNPGALQLHFFKPSEISAVLMTSDGANAIRYKEINHVLLPQYQNNVHEVEAFMQELKNLNGRDLHQKLTDLALQYSSSNHYQGGSGDDVSLVYIKRKENL